MATRKTRRAARTRTTKTRATASVTPRRRTRAARWSGAYDQGRQAPATLRLREFQPILTVNDLQRSVSFYTTVLGFVVSERWTEAGVLRGVMLKAGLSTLALSQDDWAKGRDRQKGQGIRLWCLTVQDIDFLAARITDAGGVLIEGPTDQPWGGRSLSVDDPDGFHLTFYRKQ